MPGFVSIEKKETKKKGARERERGGDREREKEAGMDFWWHLRWPPAESTFNCKPRPGCLWPCPAEF